jgi:hypothetical protein
MALGKAECGAHVVNQALVRQTAQILEQVAVEAEIDAEHLGDTEREVAVRDGKEDRLGQQGAEELNLLLVTRRAEPAAFTGEGQQILVFAVIAPDTRKTSLQVATVQELVHHIRNDWAQEAVAGLVMLFVALEKRIKMPGEALPERRGLGLAFFLS